MTRELSAELTTDEAVATTVPRSPLQRVLTIYFLAIVAVVPVVQLVVETARREPIQEADVFRRFPTAERLVAFERALEKNCLVGAVVRQRLQWLGLVALRVGNQKAVVGPEGTLFYQPSLEAALRPGFMAGSQGAGHPLAAITVCHDCVARRNIRLVVLVVPGKEAIYPEWLDPGYDPERGPAVNPDMAAFVRELRARGVEVVDPTDLLWSRKYLGELYLRHDTHWSPLGLRLVADDLARRLGPDVVGQGRFALQRVAVSAPGDLYTMLQLPTLPTPLRPQRVVVERVVDAQSGAPVEPDLASPVVLLGDSFTNIYSVAEMGWGDHAGLAEQLAYRLGRPLDVIAMNDGGVNRARVALARRPEPLAGKQVVIWQFAARDLVVSNGQWEQIALDKRKKE
jgi:alginate O-acetyltransferase complex protein AlgJ